MNNKFPIQTIINTCVSLQKIILSSPRYIDKAYEYEFLKPWLNDGLLLSTGK